MLKQVLIKPATPPALFSGSPLLVTQQRSLHSSVNTPYNSIRANINQLSFPVLADPKEAKDAAPSTRHAASRAWVSAPWTHRYRGAVEWSMAHRLRWHPDAPSCAKHNY